MSDPVRDYQGAAQVRPLEGEIPANDDRLTQARVEAERRADRSTWTYTNQKAARMHGFVQGVEWADAHPYSTPEALVAAYEDGQRDAVEKGVANPQRRTITLAQSEAILEAGRAGRYEDHEAALRAAGIEVDDAINVPTHCAACGKPATGFAMINDERFCHPDEGPSCYMGGRR